MSRVMQLSNILTPIGFGLCNKLKLSMNYMLHNEEDIIEANIRYHASIGVNSFVIIDNGSTDSTKDIVIKLAKEFDITLIDKHAGNYQQSDWKTEMAIISRRKHGANWSIANDADEFWLTTNNSLTTPLSKIGASIYCKRYNMIPTLNEFNADQLWYKTSYTANRPVALSPNDILNDPNISIMLHKIHGKIMVNNYGLVRVHGGNHRASHLYNPWLKKQDNSTVVLHYPLRGKKRFLDIIKRREKLLTTPGVKMGNHYRRWVNMHNKSTIDEEITRLAPSKQQIITLKQYGIIDRIDMALPSHKKAYLSFLQSIASFYQ